MIDVLVTVVAGRVVVLTTVWAGRVSVDGGSVTVLYLITSVVVVTVAVLVRVTGGAVFVT